MVHVHINKLNLQGRFLFCHHHPFIQESHSDWGRCCKICTDTGTDRTMTGHVKKLQVVSAAVHLIKSSAMKVRLFYFLCNEMAAHFAAAAAL